MECIKRGDMRWYHQTDEVQMFCISYKEAKLNTTARIQCWNYVCFFNWYTKYLVEDKYTSLKHLYIETAHGNANENYMRYSYVLWSWSTNTPPPPPLFLIYGIPPNMILVSNSSKYELLYFTFIRYQMYIWPYLK